MYMYWKTDKNGIKREQKGKNISQVYGKKEVYESEQN